MGTRWAKMKMLAQCHDPPEEVDAWMQALVHESIPQTGFGWMKGLAWTCPDTEGFYNMFTALQAAPGVIYLCSICSCSGGVDWFVDLRGELGEGEGAVFFVDRTDGENTDYRTHPEILMDEGIDGHMPLNLLRKYYEPMCVASGLTDFFSSWAAGGEVPCEEKSKWGPRRTWETGNEMEQIWGTANHEHDSSHTRTWRRSRRRERWAC